MLRILKQRAAASVNEAASKRARLYSRSGSLSVAAGVLPGASRGREAASLQGALAGQRWAAPEVPAAFTNRQALM
jgi:hypothetical protein